MGPSGVEGVSCDAVLCPTGFECYGGGCVRGCAADLDCGPWRCAPLPGATFGVCVEPGAVAPPNERGEVPSAPASEAPGSLPAPATAAPAPPPEEEDDPQAEVTPVGPEAPEDDAASPPVPAPGPANCAYPRDDGRFAVGLVPPDLSFPQALDARGDPRPFSLSAFHCDPAWSNYSAVFFVVGAMWCSACQQGLHDLAPQLDAIEAAGRLVVFIEAETADYVPADTRAAFRYLQREVGDGPGLRLGDADTRPAAMAVSSSDVVAAYPTTFAIRRSDARLFADDNSNGGFALDLVALARDAARAAPGDEPSPPGPGPVGGCVEEAGEPNDSVAQATALGAGVLQGGVCDGEADLFRIRHGGAWRLDLEFSHAEGDLDLYVVDEGSGGVLADAQGNVVGSESLDDDEALDWGGNATVVVVGYQGARARYSLRLTLR